jgi:Aerotolerance regulator N-terminal/von Willebrand factor type A domain
MIFLNPAVLFGLFAASIPVLIHLLNLRKLKKIDFSTLAFLKELQKNKIRKLKLKQWLLLALRVLIILFLVTAFARPTLKGVAIGGTTSAAKTSAVFILDDTFSMSVVDSKGSYLNQAKETIKKLLGQLQEGDDASLILVSDNGKSGSKLTSNISELIKQVEKVSISDKSGMLHNSIVNAAELLSQSNNFNKEIYLLSDFQRGRLANEESLSDLSQLLNDKIKLYTFDYSGKDVFNVGISNLKVNTQIFEKNKPVDFSITVTNYSRQQVKNLVVSLFLNGERTAQQSINLGADESQIVTMEAIIKETGFINVTAEIEDDDILQDNKRFTNIYIPTEIPVIIFTENPEDSRFVKLPLTAGQSQQSVKIVQRSLSQISAINLTDYDVIIIIGSGNIGSAERIKSFITNGGGLILMPGENSTLSDFQNITSRLGLPSPTGKIGKLNDKSNAVTFDKVDLQHPLFQDIFIKKESVRGSNKIESPDIYFHYRLTTEGKGKNIISLIDGSSFLSEYKIGSGKVLLYNTAPVLSWSNFPYKSIFVPLMHKSVFYLASKEREGTDYLAGDEINLSIGTQTTPLLKIIQPDKTEEIINLKDQANRNYLNYNKTDVTGNYQIFSGNNLIDEFSVNTDPLESVAKYLSKDDFVNYLKKIKFKGVHIAISKNEDPVQVVMQARFGSELWKYFLIIALILALIEMAIARNAKKEMMGK